MLWQERSPQPLLAAHRNSLVRIGHIPTVWDWHGILPHNLRALLPRRCQVCYKQSQPGKTNNSFLRLSKSTPVGTVQVPKRYQGTSNRLGIQCTLLRHRQRKSQDRKEPVGQCLSLGTRIQLGMVCSQQHQVQTHTLQNTASLYQRLHRCKTRQQGTECRYLPLRSKRCPPHTE